MGFVWGVSAAFFLLEVLTGVSADFFTDLTLAGDFGSFFGLLPFVPFLPFFVGDSGASSLADLALDDMFARLRGDEGGAFVGRGVVMVVEVFACGRGASWVWGARCLNLGVRRYRSCVGGTLGLAGSLGAGVGIFVVTVSPVRREHFWGRARGA